MIRIGILGDIGSGKTFVAKRFGYPVFDADYEVSNLYNTNKILFKRLKKKLPKYISLFPIKKKYVSKAILDNPNNLKKIIEIVHKEVKKKLKVFLTKNKNKKIVILDIPLLLENKLDHKNDILVFIHSSKSKILKKLRKRKNFNYKLFKKFKKIQLPLYYKRKRAHFVIKNKFTNSSVNDGIKKILKEIL